MDPVRRTIKNTNKLSTVAGERAWSVSVALNSGGVDHLLSADPAARAYDLEKTARKTVKLAHSRVKWWR